MAVLVLAEMYLAILTQEEVLNVLEDSTKKRG